MVFLFYGREYDENGTVQNYLYQTKEMVIKGKYKIHSRTQYIDKVVNNQSSLKLLVTLGQDHQYNENNVLSKKLTCIKLWDYFSLITESCKHPYLPNLLIYL